MVIIYILFLNQNFAKSTLWWGIAPVVVNFTFFNMNVQTQKKKKKHSGRPEDGRGIRRQGDHQSPYKFWSQIHQNTEQLLQNNF